MTTFLAFAVIVLIIGCALTKATTSSMLAKSRLALAETISEEHKTAGLRKHLEAHLAVMQGRERELIGDVKKLNSQLSELHAEMPEDDAQTQQDEVAQ